MRSRNFPFEIIRVFFAMRFSIHHLEHEVFEGIVMFYVSKIALLPIILTYRLIVSTISDIITIKDVDVLKQKRG